MSGKFSLCMLSCEYNVCQRCSVMNGVIGAKSFNIVDKTLCNVKIAPSLSSSVKPIPYALAFAISMYCAAKIFHVNSLIAVDGIKKLYFEYPYLKER